MYGQFMMHGQKNIKYLMCFILCFIISSDITGKLKVSFVTWVFDGGWWRIKWNIENDV